MKRFLCLLLLISSNAFAGQTEYFESSNGERGELYKDSSGITYYQSNRGSGMGFRTGNTTNWDGHAPGGARKCDSRMEYCD